MANVNGQEWNSVSTESVGNPRQCWLYVVSMDCPGACWKRTPADSGSAKERDEEAPKGASFIGESSGDVSQAIPLHPVQSRFLLGIGKGYADATQGWGAISTRGPKIVAAWTVERWRR